MNSKGRLRVVRSTYEAVTVSDTELAALGRAALAGHADPALAWLGDTKRLQQVAADHPNTPYCLCYAAHFAECAPDSLPILRDLLGAFDRPARARLPLDAYAHLRLTEGIVTLAGTDWEGAGVHIDLVLSLASQDLLPKSIAFLAHFWRAVLCRRQHRFDQALAHVAEAGNFGPKPILAVLEGGLQLQKERFGRCLELLREAEGSFQGAEDWFWRATLSWELSRAALAEGRYEQCVEDASVAVALFEEHAPKHRTLARALVCRAQARRFIALRLARTVHRHAAQRRKGTALPESTDLPARHRVDQLRQDALIDLDRAGAESGLERGWLFEDRGELDLATQQAAEAYGSGARTHDAARMARARLLFSRIELSLAEEGIDDDPGAHAQRAHDFAQEALTLAEQTGNRRLQAEACVAVGRIEATDNPEAARACCQKAGELLQSAGRDWLWDEYQALAVRVLRAGSVDAKLRRWSQGLVDDQTFQQMTEEFAAVVIPGVWLREGKNVSRVVARLSISPKKVRRILNRVGLKPA